MGKVSYDENFSLKLQLIPDGNTTAVLAEFIGGQFDGAKFTVYVETATEPAMFDEFRRYLQGELQKIIRTRHPGIALTVDQVGYWTRRRKAP